MSRRIRPYTIDMDSLAKDMRFAFRLLAKSPGFTLLALAALSLGIGANTAIFSVVDAVLLRPLPFAEPDRLVAVWEQSPRTHKPNVVNPQNFRDWEIRNRSFENMAAYIDTTMNLTGSANPEEVYGAYVTRQFFPILRVQPILGRNFTPDEDNRSRDTAVILSHELWQRRFGSDPNILGHKIIVQSQTATVVGVMPPNFRFPEMKAELWALYSPDPHAARKGRFLSVIARLKQGITLEQAQSDMTGIGNQLAREYSFDAQWGATTIPASEQFAGRLRTPLLVLLGAVALVLLIACANVANLMLMRSSARRREIAVRASLGATRWRLARQMLVESGLLGAAAGALGLVIALWAKRALLAMLPPDMARLTVNPVAIDGRVLAFTMALSLATGLLFGLLPALRSSRLDLSDALKEGGRGNQGSLRRNRLRAALVATEMALASMLLIGAGLLIKSLIRLEHVPAGFQPDRILTMRVNLTGMRGAKPEQQAAAWSELLRHVEQVPGVKAVGSIAFLPLSQIQPATGFWQDGRAVPKAGSEPVTWVSVVTPGYWSTMGIPVVKGRVLDATDRSGSPQVTVINQTLARDFFPNTDPIGQKLFVQWGRKTPYTIVGVVGDVRASGLDKNPMPAVYFADAQEPGGGGSIVIRTAMQPMALARTVETQIHTYYKDQPVADIQPMQQLLTEAVARPRFQSVLLAVFAGVALLLAAIGIFGVMSYSVAQRTGEIGVRVALGAQRRQILAQVVGQGAWLAMIGAAAGLAGAFALTRSMRSLLFEVSAVDPAMFVGVPLLLGAVALAASYLPARRAAGVDPLVALRHE